jgi:hypothetical protein
MKKSKLKKQNRKMKKQLNKAEGLLKSFGKKLKKAKKKNATLRNIQKAS